MGFQVICEIARVKFSQQLSFLNLIAFVDGALDNGAGDFETEINFFDPYLLGVISQAYYTMSRLKNEEILKELLKFNLN